MFRWSSAAALSVVALAACSSTVERPAGRGRLNDPRTEAGRLACLQAHRLPVTEVGATALQIGPLPTGATVRFLPTEGAGLAAQIEGQAQGAEVIGSALVYPNRASDSELGIIEDCVARGVKG